jgi:hypothetical protein
MNRGQADPVRPEVRGHVLEREQYRCVVALLAEQGRLEAPSRCRDTFGMFIQSWPRGASALRTQLTIAHVRDRGKGGRLSKRPPSTPRHLVAACFGHHLTNEPYVDRPEVRDVLDEYLEEKEGPEPPDPRWWEVVQRVRGPGRGADLIDPGASDGKV